MISLSLIVFFCLIREILLPFVLGMFIAYFLHPVIDRLERAGAARSVATLMILAGFFIIVALLSVLVIPTIFGQLSELIAALPGYVNDYQQKYAPQLSHWLGGLPAAATDDIKSAVANFSGVMVKFFGAFLDGILHSGIAFVHLLMLILITPIVAFYLLRDWKGMVTRIDNLLPREHMNVIHQQLAIIDRTLAGFVRGQLNVCLIMATYYAIGLSVVGLKFGIVIGLMTGLLVIFPYIGLMLGIAVGLGVAFFQFGDLTPMLTVLAVFLVGGSMEGYIITPKLVGSKVSLHPVWIIFGMLSGATLFGLVGILLAVPITAVIGVLIRFGTDRYLQSDYYRGTALHTAKK
jgi:predicted PurR-regulated permease PerM